MAYTINGKAFTDHALMDEIIYNAKLILSDIVLKNGRKANNAETDESMEQSDYFMAIKNGSIALGYFPLTLEMLQSYYTDEYGNQKYTNTELELFLQDHDYIPYDDRDDLLSYCSKIFLDDYVEYNEYYRMLNGLPPYGTDRYNVYISPDNPKLIVDKDGGYSIDFNYDLPIHEYTNMEIGVLDALGILGDIIEQYKDDRHYRYLNHIGDKSIDIYDARLAKDWDILYMPSCENTISYRFKELYNQNRDIYYRRTYQDAYKLRSGYYTEMLMIMTLCQTLTDLIAETPEWYIRRDIFDLRSCKYFLESQGLEFYKDIPIKYQIRLVKNINKLIRYKSTRKNIEDILKIFDKDGVTVYKYYLLKKFVKWNGDLDEKDSYIPTEEEEATNWDIDDEAGSMQVDDEETGMIYGYDFGDEGMYPDHRIYNPDPLADGWEIGAVYDYGSDEPDYVPPSHNWVDDRFYTMDSNFGNEENGDEPEISLINASSANLLRLYDFGAADISSYHLVTNIINSHPSPDLFELDCCDFRVDDPFIYFNYYIHIYDMNENDFIYDSYQYDASRNYVKFVKTNKTYSDDYNHEYEMEFIKVPIDNNYDNFIKDALYRVDYDDITYSDKYWDGEDEHDVIKYNHIDRDFTIEGTKYLDLDYHISGKKYLYQMKYLLGMILDSSIDMSDIKFPIPEIKKNISFNITSLFVFLICLSYSYNKRKLYISVPKTEDRDDPIPENTDYYFDGGYPWSGGVEIPDKEEIIEEETYELEDIDFGYEDYDEISCVTDPVYIKYYDFGINYGIPKGSIINEFDFGDIEFYELSGRIIDVNNTLDNWRLGNLYDYLKEPDNDYEYPYDPSDNCVGDSVTSDFGNEDTNDNLDKDIQYGYDHNLLRIYDFRSDGSEYRIFVAPKKVVVDEVNYDDIMKWQQNVDIYDKELDGGYPWTGGYEKQEIEEEVIVDEEDLDFGYMTDDDDGEYEEIPTSDGWILGSMYDAGSEESNYISPDDNCMSDTDYNNEPNFYFEDIYSKLEKDLDYAKRHKTLRVYDFMSFDPAYIFDDDYYDFGLNIEIGRYVEITKVYECGFNPEDIRSPKGVKVFEPTADGWSLGFDYDLYQDFDDIDAGDEILLEYVPPERNYVDDTEYAIDGDFGYENEIDVQASIEEGYKYNTLRVYDFEYIQARYVYYYASKFFDRNYWEKFDDLGVFYIDANGGVEHYPDKAKEDDYEWMHSDNKQLFVDTRRNIYGFNFKANKDKIIENIEKRHSIFGFKKGYTAEELGIDKFITTNKIDNFDDFIDIYETNSEVYDKLTELMENAQTRDQMVTYNYVFDSLFTKEYDYTKYMLDSGEIATTYDEILKERNYILYQKLVELESERDEEMRQNNIRQMINNIVATMEYYLNRENMNYLFSFTATYSFQSITKYVSYMIDFLKSWKVYFLEPGYTYGIDDKGRDKNQVGLADMLIEKKIKHWYNDNYGERDTMFYNTTHLFDEHDAGMRSEVIDIFAHYSDEVRDRNFDGGFAENIVSGNRRSEQDIFEFDDSTLDGGNVIDLTQNPSFVIDGGNIGAGIRIFDIDGGFSFDNTDQVSVDGGHVINLINQQFPKYNDFTVANNIVDGGTPSRKIMRTESAEVHILEHQIVDTHIKVSRFKGNGIEIKDDGLYLYGDYVDIYTFNRIKEEITNDYLDAMEHLSQSLSLIMTVTSPTYADAVVDECFKNLTKPYEQISEDFITRYTDDYCRTVMDNKATELIEWFEEINPFAWTYF